MDDRADRNDAHRGDAGEAGVLRRLPAAFREIDFTYYSSPMPAFEYLAAGKPIVSTPIGQIEGWNGLVSVAHGTQGFIEAIESAPNAVSAEHVSQRRVWAARNTWDVRVTQVADALATIDVDLEWASPVVEPAPARERRAAFLGVPELA